VERHAAEVEVANAICRYHREHQGRAPGRVHVMLKGNLVVVLTSDIFTPQEEALHVTDDGRKLIKSARRECRSLTREQAHSAVSRVLGCPVLRSYWDIDVRVGEQMEAYVLSEDLESRWASDPASTMDSK
jgi:uncharacterized protein YbcI